MKKLFVLSLIIVISFTIVYSQDEEIKGKPIVEIFTDFHYKLNSDSGKTNGFSVNRAYFGYTFKLPENFVATLTVDIGTPEDLATGSKPRRYAHFREASLGYTGEKLTLVGGITGTRIFSYQQKFWGKRYIANTYQSLNGYGFVADIGLVADYKFTRWLSGDFTLMNGKGYSNIQLESSLKASLGITVTPAEKYSIRLYSDLMNNASVWQNTIVGFAGFKNDFFYIGVEGSFKSNLDLTEGHHAWGVSSTGGINIASKTEFFVRYDYSSSVVPDGESLNWNYEKDGTFVIGGLQYTFNKYIKMAIDFQSSIPYPVDSNPMEYFYLNFLAKF
jgi:hypothetical protein